MIEPAKVYADGGTIGRNPSPVGGAWAFCWVLTEDVWGRVQSGTIAPEDFGKNVVTNNDAEMLAAVLALESVPDGWAGALVLDSTVTRSRLRGGRKSHPPAIFLERLARIRSRLGAFWVEIVAGHPTQKDLERGATWLGVPVSRHNVFCDSLCEEEALEVLERLAETT